MSAAATAPGTLSFGSPFLPVPRMPRLDLPDSPPRLDDRAEASIRGTLDGGAVGAEIAQLTAAVRSGPRTYAQPGPVMRALTARLRPLLEIRSELAGEAPRVDGQVGALLLQTALDAFGLAATIDQARWSVGFLLDPATLDVPAPAVEDDAIGDLIPIRAPSVVMARDAARRRAARYAERVRLGRALVAAVEALGPALAAAVRKAIDDAGGPRKVAQALGDARTLGGATGPEPTEDDARLAELKQQLEALDPDGAAAPALTAERDDLTRRIGARLDRWKADHRASDLALVDRAVSGDVASWEALRATARAHASAFAPGLADALDRAASEALGVAGVERFAGLCF